MKLKMNGDIRYISQIVSKRFETCIDNIYIFGGCLRDIINDVTPRDYDIYIRCGEYNIFERVMLEIGLFADIIYGKDLSPFQGYPFSVYDFDVNSMMCDCMGNIYSELNYKKIIKNISKYTCLINTKFQEETDEVLIQYRTKKLTDKGYRIIGSC
jgi:hypothetical protein